MEYEVHRDKKEINNSNEGIGQHNPLVSPVLKHDGKCVKDDGSRDPLVCCHMHLLSLGAGPDNVRSSLLVFFEGEDYSGGRWTKCI